MSLTERLAFFRARHDHEWTLLSGRMMTLMTSQSFLIIACGSLYSNLEGDDAAKYKILGPLLFVALIICALSSIVIAINCRVIRDWHIFRAKLFEEDKNNELGAIDIIRKTPDWKHTITADVFSLSIPLLFFGLWTRGIIHFSPFMKLKCLTDIQHKWELTLFFMGLLAIFCAGIMICGSAYNWNRDYKAVKVKKSSSD